MHRNYPKRLSESESGKITQHIDAGVDGIGQILGKFHKKIIRSLEKMTNDGFRNFIKNNLRFKIKKN